MKKSTTPKTRTYKRRVGQAGKFRTKRKASSYKTTDSYLNAIWRMNKGQIEDRIEKFNDPRSKRQIWKDSVKDYMNSINPETGKNYSLNQAIDAVQRSELVTSEERRRAEVSFSRMAYEIEEVERLDKKTGKMKKVKVQKPTKTWKDIRKAIGWKNQFNPENVVDSWTKGKLNYYRYYDKTTGKDILVVETISPQSGVQQVEIFDYGDWLEQVLFSQSKNDAKAAAEYQNIKRENEKRADEINRIRQIVQGKDYKRYK